MDDTKHEALMRPSDASETRRALLRASLGGFALAASGLFLPTDDDEAAAREGALGGAKGGRHGKDHKGRHRHRSHGNKKGKSKGHDGPPKSHGPFRATALTVVNQRLGPVTCTFYYQSKTGLDDYALPTADGEHTLAPNESFRYDPGRYRVGAFFKPYDPPPDYIDVYIDVRNISFWFPVGGAYTGEHLDPHTGNIGHAFIAEQPFLVGGKQQGNSLVLKRNPDSPDRIEWELDLLQPA